MKIAYAAFCAPMLVGVVQAATSPLEFVILLAAALAAIGVIWHKGVRPVAAFFIAATEAVEHIRSYPDFQEEVLTRLQVIEGALYGQDMIQSLPIRRRGDTP